MALPGLIEALLNPNACAGRPRRVSLRQTHVSYLIFAGNFVYKIKKPVDFGFLDFTTLEKRLHFCEEEVRLNRRLAPDVYIGVEKITGRDGGYVFGGTGEAVEYAVKMKRLPEDGMLDVMLKRDAATPEMIERVARRIASFHGEARTDGHISGFGSIETIKKNAGENFEQIEAFAGELIPERLLARIKEYTLGFIRTNGRLLEKRIGEGFIRDCHGDLHCEHVSITDGINIFDCIEFNERFRFSDVAADIAFLSMDLDYRNRNDLARVLDSAYFRATGDADGTKLMDFYRCYRACVRGKVECFKYREDEVGEAEKASSFINARNRFHLAGLYAAGGFRPTLVAVRGLSGTGKTAVAMALADALGMVVISSDAVRKGLAGFLPHERRRAPFGEGIYTGEFTAKTYRTLIENGAAFLKSGRSVVLDATFSKAGYLYEARQAASALGAGFHVIECVAGDGIVRRRLLKRASQERVKGGAASDADWEIYLRQKGAFEPVPGDIRPYTMVSTEGAMEETLKKTVSGIFG